MRIGVALADRSGPDALGRLCADVQQAVNDGFPSAWLNNIFGLDALTALAVAGRQVPGIELATAVVPTYPRHPVALAQQALTAAAATGGRITLGIGPSHKIVIEDMYGYRFDQQALHTQEYLQVLGPLLRGEPVSFRGETVSAQITLSVAAPGPVPVLVAALGPRMLRIAGELADGTVTWMAGPATMRDHIVPGITRAAQAARQACAPGGVHPAGLRDQRSGRRPRRGGEDLIHISLLALVYADFVARTPFGAFEKLGPSGYVESQGAFAARFAREMQARTKLSGR